MLVCVFFKDVGKKKKKEKRPLVSSLSYGVEYISVPNLQNSSCQQAKKNVKKQDNYDYMQENCVMQNKLPN